jgi:hypothetical protein
MDYEEENEIDRAMRRAKKEYITKEKIKANQEDIDFIVDYVKRSIVNHVINGKITIKMTISMGQIADYDIKEKRRFNNRCWEDEGIFDDWDLSDEDDGGVDA